MGYNERGFWRKIWGLGARKCTFFYIMPKPNPCTAPEVFRPFLSHKSQYWCTASIDMHYIDYWKCRAFYRLCFQHLVFQIKKESFCSCFYLEKTRNAQNTAGRTLYIFNGRRNAYQWMQCINIVTCDFRVVEKLQVQFRGWVSALYRSRWLYYAETRHFAW